MRRDFNPPADEWVLLEEQISAHQLYWRNGSLHAVRDLRSRSMRAELYRDQDGKRGAATAHLAGDDGDAQRLADARLAAGLALNPSYRLPQGAAIYPQVALGDAALPAPEDLEAWGAVLHRAAAESGVRLSTLEVFAELQRHGLEASNGRSHAWEAAHYAADVIVASGEGDDAVELRLSPVSRRLEDLMPEDHLTRAARAVRDRTGAMLPPTGAMPVILPAAELQYLIMVLRAHTNAELRYTGALQKQIGDALVACEGDPLTVRMNPLVPHAVGSRPTDGSTIPAEGRTLLDAGILRSYHATPQFAAYLDLPPTGPIGTLEVLAGQSSYVDLTTDGPVLEVVSFSSNMPDPLSGDFAAEIKMGYLHKGGRKIPIAQGSVSGNVFAAFSRCTMSRETELVDGYFGPRWIRFHGLQVAGN
jgi:predicted Zn-dependent protease